MPRTKSVLDGTPYAHWHSPFNLTGDIWLRAPEPGSDWKFVVGPKELEIDSRNAMLLLAHELERSLPAGLAREVASKIVGRERQEVADA